MRYFRLLPLLMILVMAAPAAADQLTGLWQVRGWEPGHQTTAEPDYVGQTRLTKLGAGYYLEGQLDGENEKGVGLFDPASGALSLMFEADGGKAKGIAVFKLQPDGAMRGQWLYLQDQQGKLGVEIWTRVQP